ncbi:hypothetical protein CAPTEDRAFT_201826 [Capitella teleta]|uniref:Uncharacterized protein n=1 Tax=Capitella teleta TaxID=283909 RepID=R7UL49_CAPTE|nr:hypothetical protein CAPTEDRAFT_201826 [Capitella teleta]|eukprot:ELU04513.1 hypothetical protein CAPTEDRAFT_201826 [Capitella teleta]
MQLSMFKFVGVMAVAMVMAGFFLWLAHMRATECDQRRQKIITAINEIRTESARVSLDTRISYGPAELLKKLSSPALYDDELVSRILNRMIQFPAVIEGEIHISQSMRVVVRDPQNKSSTISSP